MQFPGDLLKANGFVHPLGEDWRGYQDINPAVLPRERILDMLSKTRPEMLLAITPHGTPKQVARIIKGYVDAGLRVPKIMDRSEEHTSELQSLMRISYAVFCLKKKQNHTHPHTN